MDLMKEVEKQHLKEDIPPFRPGDTVRVHVRVVEGARERTQVFEGVVLRRQGRGLRETFISRIEVARRGRVRRARLYYLRKRTGRAARIRELR